MATALPSLTHLIECPVCMENMDSHNKPKVLPCQHTVCEKCVTGLYQRCPLCRISFPQNSSADLPTNLTNLQLCDFIRQRNMESNRKLCDFCQEDPDVITHYCKHCTDYFCSRCAKEHPEVFEDHLPVSVASTFCVKHGRSYTIFCMDCKTLLCTVCMQNKICCNNRNKKQLQDIKVQKTQELGQLTERISSEIQYNKEHVMSCKTALNDRLKTIEEIKLNVRKHIQNLQAKLKQRENKLMHEINKYESDVLQMQNTIELGNDSDILSQLKETAEAALTEGIEHILQRLPSIQAALTKSISAWSETVIPGKMTFHPLDSLQVGNVDKAKDKVFNRENCVSQQAYNIKTVSVVNERSEIGSGLLEVVFVKQSILAITESAHNRVLLVDRQGHVLTNSHKQGAQLEVARGIAYHPTQDCLVVCNDVAGCLCILDPNTLSLTKKIQLTPFLPYSVAVMSDGNIVLTDCINKKVGVFDMNGTQLCSCDTHNNATPIFNKYSHPWCVRVDRENNIYVAELEGKMIVKFSETGHMLCKWRTEGGPCGLTVWGDKVLVAECCKLGDCVREYSIDGVPGRCLITWDKQNMFGDIKCVAIHQNQLTAIGYKGLRMYKITYA